MQNYGTKKYYCPSATLLDTVRTSATPCEIRIENASEKNGYFLFANYDDDYLGDILNISKDPGMPLITWVRTGTDNQKIQFKAAELPKDPESSSSDVVPNSSSSVILSGSEESSNCENSSDENCKTGLRLKVEKPSMNYDMSAGIVRLENDSHWTIFTLNGNVVQCGFGSRIALKSMPKGTYLVRVGRETLKIVTP